MWCTRWFLPLLLLPLPTAPPYFLVLFLLALFIQAKPCFYCIVLLVALFFSSCYWQPFPSESHLFAPWADNITTFGQALNASISASYEKPLPPVLRTLDRCWCDFWTSGGFFEPFNVSQWEEGSILKVADDLERSLKAELLPPATPETDLNLDLETDSEESPTQTVLEPMPRTAAPEPTTTQRRRLAYSGSVAADLWNLVSPYLASVRNVAEITRPLFKMDNVTGLESPPPHVPLPALRWEYDLRPYGLGVVVDFSWTRSNS